MKIGQAARESGVSIRMLRYYEARGLIQPPRRESKYREYCAEDVERARRIQALKHAGLTLDVIAHILPCTESPGVRPCAKFLAALSHKLEVLDQQMALLDLQRRAITDFLVSCQKPRSEDSTDSRQLFAAEHVQHLA
mgnify:FL=1